MDAGRNRRPARCRLRSGLGSRVSGKTSDEVLEVLYLAVVVAMLGCFAAALLVESIPLRVILVLLAMAIGAGWAILASDFG